jgi:hypothetical protein
MRVSQRDDFFCLDRFKIAPGAPAPAGLRIAVRTTVLSMPVASTATAHTPADSATFVTQQQIWSVMVIRGTLVWRYVRESIDVSRPPIWNVAGTRAAPRPIIEVQLRRGRPNVDNDIGVRSCFYIAADNRRRRTQTGVVDVLPHVPPHVARLP